MFALLLLVLVSGCGGLPTTSQVMKGEQMAAPIVPPPRQRPAAPEQGAGPESIVAGFLSAGSASNEDYRAAREFLSSSLAQAWSPRSGMAMLYEGTRSLSVAQVEADGDRATVEVTAGVVATLSPDGRYTELPERAQHKAVFELARVDGEWRIQNFPGDFALWLDMFYFNASHQAFLVAYASPVARTLIPDRRFFPVTSALPTSLARAQLSPPPGYLDGAVASGFPAQTRLSVDAVTVRDGVAKLDLTAAAYNGRAEDRRTALAQAIATLTQATSVAGVSFQVDGRPLDVVGAPIGPATVGQLGFELAAGPRPRTVVLRKAAQLKTSAPHDLRSVEHNASEGTLPNIDTRYSQLAVASGMKDLAAVADDGSRMIRWRDRGNGEQDKPFRLPAFGTHLVRPSYDAHQGLWVAGRAPDGSAAIWVVDTRGEVDQATPRRLEAPWLAGKTVTAVVASSDSQRVALLLTDEKGRAEILVTGVTRSEDGRPVGLTAPLRVGGRVHQAIDIAWSSGHQLVLLGTTVEGNPPRTLLVGLDGRTETSELPVVVGARRVVTLGPSRWAVLTDKGRVVMSVGGAWQDGPEVTDLVAP